jgi:hypothetical protein
MVYAQFQDSNSNSVSRGTISKYNSSPGEAKKTLPRLSMVTRKPLVRQTCDCSAVLRFRLGRAIRTCSKAVARQIWCGSFPVSLRHALPREKDPELETKGEVTLL